MDNRPTDAASEPGLHEYVDAEFTIEGLDSTRETALRDALQKLPGLESLSILHGKVIAHYEPVFLSRKHLEEAMQRAGFRITEAKTTPSSPLTDAFEQSLLESENFSQSDSSR
jgi:hypothetical protein